MTFFNKKTEVMQIEMTPYGRYLYSIGKFKPHSYEFVDDDILYRASGSGEAQHEAHQRILNETPKLKINRAFQDEAPEAESPPKISVEREMRQKMDEKQNGLYALGKSSYSSEKLPNFQVSMLRGEISSSSPTFTTNISAGVQKGSNGGEIHIPQVNVDFNINAIVKNVLDAPATFSEFSSQVFSDGNYVELSFEDPIIHVKEFNSFYERENFDVEFFEVLSNDQLLKMKISKNTAKIINDMIIDTPRDEPTNRSDFGDIFEDYEYEAVFYDDSFFEYFFFIENDESIPKDEICKVVDKLEVNDQFIDEELICPDKRTDRFDIYATRVGPDDLEDCDWWTKW